MTKYRVLAEGLGFPEGPVWLGPERVAVTEIRGQGVPFPFTASANASRTERSAGFARRSRSVRPNFQSSTSAPPRHHSSVQEKTNAPAHPNALPSGATSTVG